MTFDPKTIEMSYEQPFERTWKDPYGGACALMEGDYGGGTLLLACTLEHSSAVLEQIRKLPRFKGNLFLCVWERSWTAPLEQAVLKLNPRTVLLISSEPPEAQTVQVESGLSFLEDGRGWQSLNFDVLDFDVLECNVLECDVDTLAGTFGAELERLGWLSPLRPLNVEVVL